MWQDTLTLTRRTNIYKARAVGFQFTAAVSKLKMCSGWLNVEVINTRKFFTLVCFVLTLFLISKLLFTFGVTKPTTTFKEEKELETIDLPEIVVCSDPGFKLETLKKYGYQRGFSYYLGDILWRFSGWNGGVGVQNSSQEILEESLMFDSQLVNDKRTIKWAGYSYTGGVNGTASMKTQRPLVYPHGRCLSFSPKENGYPVKNMFYILLNDSSFVESNIKTIKLFFMDKTSSLRLYPDDTEMFGDPITINMAAASPQLLTYKTHIFRSQNIEGDPSLECADYTRDKSYYGCIQNELVQFFKKTIGCLPPPLFHHANSMCNRKFNSSRRDARSNENIILLRSLYQHDLKFKCRTPCQTNRYSTRLLNYDSNKNYLNGTELLIIFDKTVEVVRTKFSTDIEMLLTGLGGSVSSGRTLLWVLLSFLTASQVFQINITVFLINLC